jgi:hypothetical protein
LRQYLRNLLSSDYPDRLEAEGQLKQVGREAADAIIPMMIKAPDLSAFPAFTHALEEIGKAAGEPACAALETLEVRRERDVYLAECLIEVLRQIRDRRTAPVIARMIDKFNAVIERNGNSVLVSICQHARLKAHLVLGEFGDRSRVQDLMNQIERDRRLLHPSIIEVLAELGDKRALVPLLKIYASVDSLAIQEDAGEAIRDIIKREHVAPGDPVFDRLKKTERILLNRVFPGPRAANGNGHSA